MYKSKASDLHQRPCFCSAFKQLAHQGTPDKAAVAAQATPMPLTETTLLAHDPSGVASVHPAGPLVNFCHRWR